MWKSSGSKAAPPIPKLATSSQMRRQSAQRRQIEAISEFSGQEFEEVYAEMSEPEDTAERGGEGLCHLSAADAAALRKVPSAVHNNLTCACCAKSSKDMLLMTCRCLCRTVHRSSAKP